jgi:hypothetical protein
LIGWVLGALTLLYLLTPKNAQRAVEHARGHAAHQPSDAAIARRDSAKPHKH